MNITHADKENVNGDRLQSIFNRQKELMTKYHPIEARSGLLQTEDCPIDLNDKAGQARIKDFSWRFVEEIGEAIDARKKQEHFEEELIDALHFLVELTILGGKDYNTISQFTPEEDEVDYLGMLYNDGCEFMLDQENIFNICTFSFILMQLIENLGMMCNSLKNKPWKQTFMKTDKKEFYKRLEMVWVVYLALLNKASMTPDEITEIYLKKSQVNKFRQRSNY